MPSEADLDLAFASAVETSLELQSWLLSGGRFARFAGMARLLVAEQAAIRQGAAHWWKHWWCKLPSGEEGETDIFLVFDAAEFRFAIHLENKPAFGKISIKQASGYRRRASFMAHSPRWLDYHDFETILLAPKSFIAANSICSEQFDRAIEYESVAQFVPLFANNI